jgi:hypothetical protein
MPSNAADRYAIIAPLLIWTVSLFMPAVTYDRNDWFFPGRNLGVLAIWMSILALVLFLTALKQYSRDPAMLLYGYIALLWVANILMIMAPFKARAIRQGRGRGFLITMWIWFFLALSLSALLRLLKLTESLACGYFVWLISLLTMALYLTATYVQGPRNQPTLGRLDPGRKT